VKSKSSQLKVINYAFVAKTHTSMYLMHKYWARKPHNVVSEYIKHHTKEGLINKAVFPNLVVLFPNL